MTNNDKSQPTGWVVVCFEDSDLTVYDGRSFFGADDDAQTWRKVNPYQCEDYAEAIRTGDEEVHPWPLPASALARLKDRHPGQDWSQVPVAGETAEPSEVEKLRGALIECIKACGGGATERVSTEFLLRTPNEVRLCVEKLRAERNRAERALIRAGFEDRGGAEWAPPVGPSPSPLLDSIDRLTRERDEHRSEADVLRKDLAAYADQLCKIWGLLPDDVATKGGSASSAVKSVIDRLTRERDEARAELAATADTLQDWKRLAESALKQKDALDEELSRCKQAHSAAEDDVESLREQLGKSRLSRLDEFAKAALMGLCTHALTTHSGPTIALMASDIAQATIRAIDGAGGA